jgi:hypothetical protein
MILNDELVRVWKPSVVDKLLSMHLSGEEKIQVQSLGSIFEGLLNNKRQEHNSQITKYTNE